MRYCLNLSRIGLLELRGGLFVRAGCRQCRGGRNAPAGHPRQRGTVILQSDLRRKGYAVLHRLRPTSDAV